MKPALPGVVVLIYHQVGAPVPGAVNVPTAVFRDQIAWLAEHAEVLSLDSALDLLRGGKGGAKPPEAGRPKVVITFDDGTADFAANAVPVLAEHGLPATLYLATAYVDEERSFWDDGTVLSWAALGEACATGVVSVGSHTHSHALLDRMPTSEIGRELDRSTALIAEHLGIEAKHFAYPKALAGSLGAEGLVRARFSSAALAGGRTNPVGTTDPYRLWRTPVQVDDGLRWLEVKARGGLRLEGVLRERLDRRRYSGADS